MDLTNASFLWTARVRMTNPKADRLTAYTGLTLLTRASTIPTTVWATDPHSHDPTLSGRSQQK